MRFAILGPTRIGDGSSGTVGGPRLRGLLALLLLDAGRVVPAERLIDGLYGDNPPRGAANALQSQVSRLRQALPAEDGPLVEFHPAGYRLPVDPEDVDAHRFSRLAADGRRALRAGGHARAAALLSEALGLWRGPALADVAELPFAQAQAARLEELRLSTVEDRAEAEIGLGQPAGVVAEVRELVAAHPLRERARALLLRALSGSGRPAEALAEFEDARRVLAEELGADPSPELAKVHLAVLRGGDSGPPGQAPSRLRLPSQLTTFVGREEELHRVGKLLDGRRLVTLVGPGGAGKTRMAVEAAERQDGDACFVDLSGLTGATEVPQAVLSALDLREAGLRPAASGADITERLATALADRRLLLILDNCEHVVAGAAQLAQRLLGSSPQLRVLATSREPLGVTGEVLHRLSGLALPEANTPPESLGEFAAVRLFADRAADAAPDFAITPGSAEAVLRICRRLDGLPLGIELAAARLGALPVEEIAARLDDRFRLLSRGSRTAQPRHQTLRAVVEWSWDLLDEDERILARRLTVFTGGATLEAVERVCGPVGRDILDLLTDLTDKSLVEGGDGRYRMLDTVRAFCAERLKEAGETERLLRAHAAYFLELAWQADPHLRRAEQLEWLRLLDAERDNLHTALHRAAEDGRTETGMRLVSALSCYWWLRGLRGEAAARAGAVLAAAGPHPPTGLDEEYALCVLLVSVGGAPGAAGQASRVQEAARVVYSLERPPRQPLLFFLAGMASGPPADGLEGVAALQEKTWQLLSGDPWTEALAPIGTGLVLTDAGQLDAAELELSEALRRSRALGDRWGTMLALSVLAEVFSLGEEPARAAAAAEEALKLAEELGSTVDVAELLATRGKGYLRAGKPADARADFTRAAELARRAGAADKLAEAHLGLAELALHDSDLPEARRLAETALAECPSGWFAADEIRSNIQATLDRIAAAE